MASDLAEAEARIARYAGRESLPFSPTSDVKQFHTDLRLILSANREMREANAEARTVINDLLMPIPHTEASHKARQRAADFLARSALTTQRGDGE